MMLVTEDSFAPEWRVSTNRSGTRHISSLEDVVAKRESSPYRESTQWLKIRNPDYSQKEGRSALFNERFHR